jgi:HTH-type transcriptional regulator / antitoxin HipB
MDCLPNVPAGRVSRTVKSSSSYTPQRVNLPSGTINLLSSLKRISFTVREYGAESNMQITSAREFGELIRKVRTGLKLTQTDVTGASGVGLRFVVDLEHGKPTCELEKALHVALMLGIKLEATGPSLRAEATDQ